ncbi:Methyltransferase domain-containing protein [Ruegeria halocynthiae]|uniref:Methyltransferase domain-containing protein n=1 Tax=Ruegeria halocynthiae TaxID=985054 RepID=A0A1H3F590_9RHOB|nr:class I SAM-dependent methyltransferase [Ruegeria halocynthiae]SDX85508.1 Methyltransferase domain-containing protein [Ruegeria halocynthiae]
MAYNYDKLYGEKPNALGEPTQVFVAFFDQFDRTGARVLDVGCGQGRDALFIARRGHHVVGVDISPNGIQDLIRAARSEALTVEGIVADITTYEPMGKFDVVLVDRTLHMLSATVRKAVLERLLDHVDVDGWLLIADEASNINGFKDVIQSHQSNWSTELSKRGYLFIRRS